MSGSVGHTYIYNIIILFIVVVFAFLMGTLSYYKAFKVNNTIVGSIEKFEGYNSLSKPEIENNLRTIGYQDNTDRNCPEEYKDMYLVSVDYEVDNEIENFRYCIYIDVEHPKSGTYYQYGVLTYMSIDLPIINRISLPIFTRTNRIYKFTKDY